MNSSFRTNQSTYRVILIDDEPSVLLALKLLLQTVGYSVTSFSSPVEALEYLKSNGDAGAGMPADLIISDFKMPKLNGLALLTEAKKVRPELPFILMSAHASIEEQERARALGSAGFLAKPFTPDQLHKLINSLALPVAC